MRLIHRIILTLLKPFDSVVHRFSSADSLVGRSVGLAHHGVSGVRTTAAPLWRKLVRAFIVLLGFGIFATLQFGMGYLIDKLWWWYIIAFFIIVGSFVLANITPIAVFVAWLIISPFGKNFLYMDMGWHAFPALSFDFIAIYFLAGVLVVKSLANRSPVRKFLWAEWLMLAFVVYVAANMAIISQPSSVMDIVRLVSRSLIPEVLVISVLYFVTKATIQKKEHIIWIIGGMVAFGFLMGVVAFYEHYTGNRWYSLIVGFGIPLAWQGIAEGRASGMFDHAAAPAAMIATTLFLTYHIAGWAQRFWLKLLCYAAIVIMVVGAYFTYTRNVYIVLVLFMFLMPFLASGKRIRYAMLLIIAVLIGSFTIPALMSNKEFHYRMTNRKNADLRLVYAKTTLNVIRHNFWFGVGWGNCNRAQEKYVTSMKHHNYAPGSNKLGTVNISHNTYLTIMAEEGVFGTLMYFGAIAAFMWRMLKIRARVSADHFLGKDFVTIMFVSSVGFLVSISAASIYLIPYVNYIFWIQFALVVRLEELMVRDNKTLKAGAEDAPLMRRVKSNSAY